MTYTQIPIETFNQLQINTGILLKAFDPETGPKEENKLGATTGGINFTATPTDSDFGEDIDNCPKNIKYCCVKLKDISRHAITGAKRQIVVT